MLLRIHSWQRHLQNTAACNFVKVLLLVVARNFRPHLHFATKVTSFFIPPARRPASRPTGPRITAPAAAQPMVPPSVLTFSSDAISTDSNCAVGRKKDSVDPLLLVIWRCRASPQKRYSPFRKSPACMTIVATSLPSPVCGSTTSRPTLDIECLVSEYRAKGDAIPQRVAAVGREPVTRCSLAHYGPLAD